jgi:hypothetical protein
MNGNGGGGMIVLILIIFLIAAGVGGYFGYTKWWVPKQCVGQDPDKTSNVSTFMYDSKKGVCVANVCIDGYGDAANAPVKGVCTQFTPKARSYSAVTNKTGTGGTCTSDGSSSEDGTTVLKVASSSSTSSDSLCGVACDSLTGCLGYDWDSTSGTTLCNLYTDKPVGALTTPTTTACHNNPTTTSKK